MKMLQAGDVTVNQEDSGGGLPPYTNRGAKSLEGRWSLRPENIKVWSAGVDWVTYTRKGRNSDWSALCEQFRLDLLAGAGVNGELCKHGKYAGYEGIWVGTSFFFGERESDFSQIVVGVHAFAERVFLGFMYLAHNCSRVDLALTVNLKKRDYHLGKALERAISKRRDSGEKQTVNGRPIKWHYHGGFDGGYTLNVGVRQSRAFGRVYNKEVQSGHALEYKHAWRWELELKEDYSKSFWLAAQIFTQMGELLYEKCAATIIDWFSSKFVEIPSCLDVVADKVALISEPTQTSLERRLAWLRKQVAPSVGQLLDLGLRKEVWRALRLRGKADQDDLVVFAQNIMAAVITELDGSEND